MYILSCGLRKKQNYVDHKQIYYFLLWIHKIVLCVGYKLMYSFNKTLQKHTRLYVYVERGKYHILFFFNFLNSLIYFINIGAPWSLGAELHSTMPNL